MFKQFYIPEPTKPEIKYQDNIPKSSPKQTFPSVANLSTVNISSSTITPEESDWDDELIDLSEEKEIYTVFKHFNNPDPTKPEIKYQENIPNTSHNQTFPSVPTAPEESDLEVETYEGERLEKDIQESAVSELAPPTPEPHPRSSDTSDPKVNSQDTSSSSSKR